MAVPVPEIMDTTSYEYGWKPEFPYEFSESFCYWNLVAEAG
jgi:hypothetical protein